jgi:hypothetical protein
MVEQQNRPAAQVKRPPTHALVAQLGLVKLAVAHGVAADELLAPDRAAAASHPRRRPAHGWHAHAAAHAWHLHATHAHATHALFAGSSRSMQRA